MKFRAVLSAALKLHKVLQVGGQQNTQSASTQTAIPHRLSIALNSAHADFGQSMAKTNIAG